jgi:hypothetical protein
MPSPADTVLAFIRAINSHEIATLTNLMTTDHEFVDSLGVVAGGRDQMRQAWIAYFFMIPDYRIEVAGIFSLGTRYRWPHRRKCATGASHGGRCSRITSPSARF